MRTNSLKSWSGLAACVAAIGLSAAFSDATKTQQGAQQGPQVGNVRFELAPAGNEARYRVREQLLSINFPSDAIGMTSAITGGIVLDAAGKVVSGLSKFTVDITGLKSDSPMRDRIIQGRTLHTAQFPTVEVTVRDLPGFKFPLPAAGEMRFQLVGDLTIHGVTKPATGRSPLRPRLAA